MSGLTSTKKITTAPALTREVLERGRELAAAASTPMHVINDWPPQWIRAGAVKLGASLTTVFTYGDTIYAPGGGAGLPWYLLAHEAVHRAQQGASPDEWWKRYFVDREFRLAEELKAYRREYAVYAAAISFRDYRDQFLISIAGHLARVTGIDAKTAARAITGAKV